jgi:hypothetical protein
MASGVQDKVAAAEGKMSAAADKMSQTPAQLGRQTAGNPLAVGLIAVGAGWLVGSLLPGTSAEERAAVKVKETAAPAITGAAKETAASLQDSAQQAVEAVKATATDAAATVKDESASTARDIRDQAQAARDTVTESRQ